MRPRRRRRGFANERPIRRFAHRVNNQIDAKDVRLISETGEQLGVRRVADALAYARERDLDLVEVAPTADPPVCRVTDYSKWRYDEERKARESRRHRTRLSAKEVRLRPKIGSHDYDWKLRQAAAFLRARSTVRLVVVLRGRERAYPDRARAMLDKVAADLAELGSPEGSVAADGRGVAIVLTPRRGDDAES